MLQKSNGCWNGIQRIFCLQDDYILWYWHKKKTCFWLAKVKDNRSYFDLKSLVCKNIFFLQVDHENWTFHLSESNIYYVRYNSFYVTKIWKFGCYPKFHQQMFFYKTNSFLSTHVFLMHDWKLPLDGKRLLITRVITSLFKNEIFWKPCAALSDSNTSLVQFSI